DRLEGQGSGPLLSGVSPMADDGLVRGFLERLVEVASRDGRPKMATLPRAMRRDLDVAGLFAASVRQDSDRITEVATASGADPEALQAVAALVSIPFLQACPRRWGRAVSTSWAKG